MGRIPNGAGLSILAELSLFVLDQSSDVFSQVLPWSMGQSYLC